MKKRICGPVATGRVTAHIIEADGTRRLVFAGRKNTLGADMIGRLCYYIAHMATTQPVTHVGLTYVTTEVFTDGISNAAATAYSTTGYQWVSTGSWLNNTGASKTITDLRLISGTSDPIVKYATLAGQSIVVGIGATLEVQWTIILRQNSSGGTGMPVAIFLRLCNYLRVASTTDPIKRAWFYDNHGTIVNIALSDPISGGGTSSSNIVWEIEGTSPTGGDTLAAIRMLNAGADIPWDYTTGFSDTWVAGTKIAVTATCTPTSV